MPDIEITSDDLAVALEEIAKDEVAVEQLYKRLSVPVKKYIYKKGFDLIKAKMKEKKED